MTMIDEQGSEAYPCPLRSRGPCAVVPMDNHAHDQRMGAIRRGQTAWIEFTAEEPEPQPGILGRRARTQRAKRSPACSWLAPARSIALLN